MRLNPDCTRDILLALESCELIDGSTTITFPDFDNVREELGLTAYTSRELEYHMRQCDMSGLLVGAKFGGSGTFSVIDITPDAHKFLADIRSKSLWSKAKEIGKQAGVLELNALISIAHDIASSAIQAHLGF